MKWLRLARLAWPVALWFAAMLAAFVVVVTSAEAHTIIVHHSKRVTRYETRPQCMNGQFCRMVRVPVDATVSHWGSGVVIGKHQGEWVALTAAHVVNGVQVCQVQTGPGVKWQTARVIGRHRDGQVDVAILSFVAGDLKPRGIADRDPAQGEQVVTWGAGANQVAVTRRGYVESVTGAELRTQNTPVQDGESGGPVVDMNGKIVGVISGYRAQNGVRLHAVSTTASALRRFVVATIGAVPGESRDELPAVPEVAVKDLPAIPGLDPNTKATRDQTLRNKAMILAMKQQGETITALLESQTEAIEAMSSRLAQLESEAPRQGERGPAGPQGPRGPAGESADVSALEGRVAQLESESLVVETIRPDGKLRSREVIERGEPIRFRLVESDVTDIDNRLKRIEKKLSDMQNTETPIRVYWGSQDAVSEGKARILNGEPIELNFERRKPE